MILSDPLGDSWIKSSLKVARKPRTSVTDRVSNCLVAWTSLYLWALPRKKMNYLFICYHKGEWKSKWEKKSLLFSNKLLGTVGQPVLRKKKRKQRPSSPLTEINKKQRVWKAILKSPLPHSPWKLPVYSLGFTWSSLKKTKKLGVFIICSPEGTFCSKPGVGRLELRHSPRWGTAKKPGRAERRQ